MSRCTEDFDGLYYIVLLEFEDELALEFLKERAPQASLFVSPCINMTFEQTSKDHVLLFCGTTAQRDELNDGAAQRTAAQRDSAIVRCKRRHKKTAKRNPLEPWCA